MGKKGKTNRLKRKPAPRFWPIHRKEFQWIVKPSCGPHSMDKCLPLALVLRDIVGVAKTRKEAKLIVSQGKVCVDGKVRRKDDFPIGLMDIISMPDMKKFYRVMPSHKGLMLNPISEEEAKFKLFRVEDKIVMSNDTVQVSLHDGSTLRVKIENPENPQEVPYATFDVIKASLPDKEVLSSIKIKEGNLAVITGGQNIGKQGRIVEIEKTEAKKRRNALVVIEDEKGNRYQTILDFVFSVGDAEPLISLPEVASVV
ncbi:30S ribosomal protein S4e [Candidatus Bathyarchaeota archaeon A05DMB-2]|nr:30S ribosomal protein S4e [Candidatus Bathyarchaeota archaeon A05DMB-2]